MSQEVKFTCNLCRESWSSATAAGGIIGLRFNGTSTFAEAAPAECHTHICLICIGEIEKLIKRRRAS